MVPTVFYSNDAVLRWDNHLSMFEVVEPIGVTWVGEDGKVKAEFTVKRGFMTNLASIPQALTVFIPKVAHHLRPSVVHDWTYEDKTALTRLEADDLFADGMKEDGVSWFRRRAMYQSVRAFGEALWGTEEEKKELKDDEEDFID